MSSKLKIGSRVALSDGNSMPLLGLGVWDAKSGKETYDAVIHALSKGYRHIDTAEMYGNEKDVGSAVTDSGIAREEIFITTKLWDSGLGYDHALNAFDVSCPPGTFDCNIPKSKFVICAVLIPLTACLAVI